LCAAASFGRIKSKDPEEKLLESISQSGEKKRGKGGIYNTPDGSSFVDGILAWWVDVPSK
jgi:hypothetical protein